MLLQVQRDHGLDAGALLGVEVAAGGEVVGQGPGLVAGPGLEGGDELALVDQADLEASSPKSRSRSAADWAMKRVSGRWSPGG